MRPVCNSFASNGECGLKHGQANGSGSNSKNSFASNGECGLKPTRWPSVPNTRCNSFASNGECGLKPCVRHFLGCAFWNSFASNGECGLKQRIRSVIALCCLPSPLGLSAWQDAARATVSSHCAAYRHPWACTIAFRSFIGRNR